MDIERDDPPVRRHFGLGVIGTLLLAAGAILLADILGWLPAAVVESPWDLWPLVLVVIGARAAWHTEGLARLVAVALLAGGLVTLGTTLGLLEGSYEALHLDEADPRLLWALALLGAGAVLVFGRRLIVLQGDEGEDTLHQLAVFGGFEVHPQSKDFRGGWLAGVFGGFEVDLRQAEIRQGPVRIDVVALFGGGEIKVPRHWRVSVTGLPVFGGYSNDSIYEPRGDEEGPRVVISGTSMFGGFAVTN